MCLTSVSLVTFWQLGRFQRMHSTSVAPLRDCARLTHGNQNTPKTLQSHRGRLITVKHCWNNTDAKLQLSSLRRRVFGSDLVHHLAWWFDCTCCCKKQGCRIFITCVLNFECVVLQLLLVGSFSIVSSSSLMIGIASEDAADMLQFLDGCRSVGEWCNHKHFAGNLSSCKEMKF